MASLNPETKCERNEGVLETRNAPNREIHLPEDRFVEYEESDYPWLSFFGLARREQDNT